MKTGRATVLTVLLGFTLSLVSGQTQTAILKINDGVGTLDDGETQVGKQVVITCEFDSGLRPKHSRVLRYSPKTDADNWETVVFAHTLQGDWANDDDYTADEVYGEEGEVEVVLTFTIKASTAADEGNYKCEVYTKSGDTEIKVSESEKKLQIFALTERVEVAGTSEGKIKATADVEQTITCRAINGSKPVMELKVGGVVVLENMPVMEVSSGLYEAKGDQTFTTEQNGAEVACSASVNTFTQAIEGKANLEITAKPVISCSPLSRAAKVGTTISFTCTITGIPLPRAAQVSWSTKNEGTTLAGTEDIPDKGLKSVATVDNDKLKVVLEVTVMATRKTEEFTISAVNDGGAVADYVRVQLQEPGKEGESTGDGGPPDSASALTVSLSTMFLLVTHLLL